MTTNLFKSFTLKWWQASLFKLAMLAAGVAIGTYWSTFFRDYLPVLILVAVLAASYVTYVWWKQ
jgi:hypothetical protein